ncbi:Zinc finger, CCCH-type [Dillenia turbinata]|uniref:Zinc finger, CCCH-type n=1 Tax=Dillenia turbinata TaxID=194707 RepID=A0AAN8VL36_9MAGN
MVGGAKDPSQQPSAEDEAVKRNTDCVYFLASPLTCKKGSECEYRHSEPARLNPRDCWFWMNGNCLNPKCSFRHPPLDGLLGTQAATAPAAQSSVPRPQPPTVASAPHTLNSVGKQAVPCIFFQKGVCLKGDRCSFLHGTNLPTTNKAPLAPVSNPSAEAQTNKKTFGGLERCSQLPKVPPQVNNTKPVEMPSILPAKPEVVAPKIGVPSAKCVQPSRKYDDELPRNKAVANIPPATNGNSTIRSIHMHQAHVSHDPTLQGGRDADEFLKESSPGFDVLVDDELQDSDYYHDEDQYGRSRGHDGRSLTSRNEYDLVHSGDYNSMSDLDQEYRDPHGYESYESMQNYAWEQHRASSSERMAVGSVNRERRGYARDGSPSPDDIDGSDLRYHLSKQRRTNGLRSVINTDYVHDKHTEEQNYGGSYQDWSHLPPPLESSLSSRLRGRIVLPGRSSPVNGSDLHRERDTDRGWNRSRLPVGRQPVSSPHGRLWDRIKGRVQEDFNNEGRNARGLRMTRDSLDDRSASVTDFAGPKSLAELKGEKNPESKELQNKSRQPFYHQSDGDLSFEGPKPLGVILKRKRESETDGSTSLGNKEANERLTNDSSKTSELESQGFPSSEPVKLPDSQVLNNKKESNTTTAADGLVPSEKAQSSVLDIEDGIIADAAGEDHNLESYDQRDGDSDFEQVEGGDYNDVDEGDNVDPEEEYLDDEDGDDFAKRIGVMFS